MKFRQGLAQMRRMPLYPLVPLVPLALIGGALTLALINRQRIAQMLRGQQTDPHMTNITTTGGIPDADGPDQDIARADTSLHDVVASPEFPHAPEDWTPQAARALAAEEHINVQADHWHAIRTLQKCYRDNKDIPPHMPDLKRALEVAFTYNGGNRHLYELFPGGPLAQGCRLAGLKPPAGAVDNGFGSVA